MVLSPVPHPSAGDCVGEGWLPLPRERSARTGRDWGVLGTLPRRGGLWDRAQREHRSTGLDAAEVGAYLLPNSSFFPGLIGSCPWVSSAWLGKGCSVQLRPSGHKQEGRGGRGIVVGCFREARGRAVARLSLAMAHAVEGAVSQLGASHPRGAGGGRE